MFGKLFSGIFGGDNTETPSREGEAMEYNGYLIVPQCEDKGGQFRVSGWIRKPASADEAMKEHRFERSDVVPGREACEELMISKAQRMIDDTGDELFNDE